jgi:hypothetical protein
MVSQTRLWIFIEWAATITLIIGVALTEWNLYTINKYINVIGNLLWFFLAVKWNKWSLIIIQTFVLLLYLVGVIKLILGV